MVDTFQVLDVFGLALLSRFAQSQGLVTLRQTFVRRSHARGFMLIARTIQSTGQRPDGRALRDHSLVEA